MYGPLVGLVSELKPKLLVEAAEACRPGVHERRPYISERIDHGVDLGTGEQFRGRCVLQLRSCRDAFGRGLAETPDAVITLDAETLYLLMAGNATVDHPQITIEGDDNTARGGREGTVRRVQRQVGHPVPGDRAALRERLVRVRAVPGLRRRDPPRHLLHG
jgi:hypothetical protein